MERETAGDPIHGTCWVRMTAASIAEELGLWGIQCSDTTVRRVLFDWGFKQRVNRKMIATAMHPDRDGQFKLIHIVRNCSDPERSPVISIDTKKKEPIGLFRNPGTYWGRTPVLVYDHDFRSLADGIAIPYAVYDLCANAGVYYLGTSYDTSEFAVNSVATWWADTGQFRYPNARKLCILADSGGSNGCRPRAWKYFLQHNLVNPFQIIVQVTHYPTGTSKWNPVDH